MAFAERLYFFRLMRNLTQKVLGLTVGFPDKNADVRIAQYESGDRMPKPDVVDAVAQALDVSPRALTVPDIDSYTGLMHTLFTLEDVYGLRVRNADGRASLQVDVRKNRHAAELDERLCAWMEQADKLDRGEITQNEYDRWRYRYPELDTSRIHVHVPSAALMDDINQPHKQRAKKK